MLSAHGRCREHSSHVHSNYGLLESIAKLEPTLTTIESPGEQLAAIKSSQSSIVNGEIANNPRADAGPVVDVRCVLFTVANGKLLVALDKRGRSASLPRSLPVANEPLDATARRTIRESTGLQEQYLEQLYTLSFRDSDGWSVIVSYVGLIYAGPEIDALSSTTWFDSLVLPKLSGADDKVIEYALLRLRAKLGYTNIAFHLLPRAFTLTELQNAYESILGRRLDKRNFRRRAIASGILQSTNQQRREGSHRPAALYRFRAEHDPADYLTPAWADEA